MVKKIKQNKKSQFTFLLDTFLEFYEKYRQDDLAKLKKQDKQFLTLYSGVYLRYVNKQNLEELEEHELTEFSDILNLPKRTVIYQLETIFSIKLNTTKFTQDEKNLIIQIANNFEDIQTQAIDWSVLVKQFNQQNLPTNPLRSLKMIKQMYSNHINPCLDKKKWTFEEDLILIQTIKEQGKKWYLVERKLKSRNQNQIKNRFNKLMRILQQKQFEQDQENNEQISKSPKNNNNNSQVSCISNSNNQVFNTEDSEENFEQQWIQNESKLVDDYLKELLQNREKAWIPGERKITKMLNLKEQQKLLKTKKLYKQQIQDENQISTTLVDNENSNLTNQNSNNYNNNQNRQNIQKSSNVNNFCQKQQNNNNSQINNNINNIQQQQQISSVNQSPVFSYDNNYNRNQNYTRINNINNNISKIQSTYSSNTSFSPDLTYINTQHVDFIQPLSLNNNNYQQNQNMIVSNDFNAQGYTKEEDDDNNYNNNYNQQLPQQENNFYQQQSEQKMDQQVPPNQSQQQAKEEENQDTHQTFFDIFIKETEDQTGENNINKLEQEQQYCSNINNPEEYSPVSQNQQKQQQLQQQQTPKSQFYTQSNQKQANINMEPLQLESDNYAQNNLCQVNMEYNQQHIDNNNFVNGDLDIFYSVNN